MNIQIGRGGEASNTRLEAELTEWLHGFEPAGTPIAVRLRTYADLRDEASRPRPRFGWLRPILSTASSVASTGAAAGGVGLVALIGLTLDHSANMAGAIATPLNGGQTGIPPVNDYHWMPDPTAVLALLVAGALAGALVFVPWLRTLAARLAFGAKAIEAAPPLPFKRRWRSISPLVWVLAAVLVLFVVEAALAIVNLPRIEAQLESQTGGGGPSFAPLILYSVFSPITWTVLAIAVPLRYPLKDRSGRLLLLGVLAPLAGLGLAWAANLSGHFTLEAWDALAFLSAASIVAIAIGLARRSGSPGGPPRLIAAVAVGMVFLLIETTQFLYGLAPDLSLPGIKLTLYDWATHLSWLAILWLGFAASRRQTNPWGWRLVFAAGVLSVIPWITYYLLTLLSMFSPALNVSFDCSTGVCTMASPSSDLSGSVQAWLNELRPWSDIAAQFLAQISLAAALLIGLRPVPREEPPSEASAKLAEGEARPEAAATAAA